MSTNPTLSDAEAILFDLASVFYGNGARPKLPESQYSLNPETRYRALVEQIPAVVFMANLDRGFGEAYVSPQIEEALGFSQSEWLEDPIRWYQRIHPEDKQRWSTEAAEMFLTGKPLRSSYRVIARDGRVIWFQCEAKMIREPDGRPLFIHGVGFDITELKRTGEALEEERNVLAAILDTVGALVVVLDPEGRIVRFNRACEDTTGYVFAEVKGRHIWDLLLAPEECDRFRAIFAHLQTGASANDYDCYWETRHGGRRLITWSTTVLPRGDAGIQYIIATGVDRTERKRLEETILEISGSEQRRIGQDLHDGLGQHLTGIAFMSKVLQERLMEKSIPEAADAAKIVGLVNEGIHKTRELARGLLPVLSEADGLMSALQQWASEVEDLFGVRCSFECDEPVFVGDVNIATQLYYIAHEAVHNAIKHGKARRVMIRLRSGREEGALTIRDNGGGMPTLPANHTGMGLRIMNHRAGIIGGSLRVERAGETGTLVTCAFPMKLRPSSAQHEA